jgi:hypothetical protein
MTLENMKLIMALFAITLICLPFILTWVRKKIGPGKNYKLYIQIRCESGSIISINKYYRFEFMAVLAAWVYAPDPKLPWVISVQTQINNCNG